jgi:hypothetical protein
VPNGPDRSRRQHSLIGAIVLLGGIGYPIDYWRGTRPGFWSVDSCSASRRVWGLAQTVFRR